MNHGQSHSIFFSERTLLHRPSTSAPGGSPQPHIPQDLNYEAMFTPPPEPPIFSRPSTPAAKALHIIRLNKLNHAGRLTLRNEIVAATGASQPTVARAVTALLNKGLLRERPDLAEVQGRGRPSSPLEIAPNDWRLAGIAVGTSETFVALYDIHGRIIADTVVHSRVAHTQDSDFLEHIIAAVHRLSTHAGGTLMSLGVTTSGYVSPEGCVDAPNLGWHHMNLAERLRYHFALPVSVTSAVPAILASEIQSEDLPAPAATDTPPRVLVLFADDSIGAAFSNELGVHSIPTLPSTKRGPAEEVLSTSGCLGSISLSAAVQSPHFREVLDARARGLGEVACELCAEHQPATVVLAGSAFSEDPRAPKIFAEVIRSSSLHYQPELRMIRSHQDMVQAIARAVALDRLLRAPLSLGSTF